MGKNGARHRAGKGTPVSPGAAANGERGDAKTNQDGLPNSSDDRAEKTRLSDSNPSEFEDESDDDQHVRSPDSKQRDRVRRKRDERKSNAVITVIAILVVGALVAVTIRQRWKYENELRRQEQEVFEDDDDLKPLEDLYDDSDASNSKQSRGSPGGDGRASPEDRNNLDEDIDDYDNPDGDDEEDDGSQDTSAPGDGDGQKSRREQDAYKDDLAGMQPTDPMEEDDIVPDDRDQHLEKPQDGNDKYEGTLASLMRPHEPLKINFWRNIANKAATLNATSLHPNGNILHIENLLTTTECLQMIQHHESLVSEHANPPPWCFEDENWVGTVLDEEKIGKDTETFQINQAGSKNMFCAQSDEVHDRLSARYPHSQATLVARGENEAVDAVERKLDSKVGLPKDNAYHTQLIKYRQGETYYPHVDCDPTKTAHTEARNDRLATIIIYLSDVKQGGGTTFPKLGVTVKPKRGSAIVFRNLDEKAKCNMQMLHKGDAPLSGVKYIYQHWYHETIILPSYMQNVVLCDASDSCREYIHAKATREASKIVSKGDMARPNIKKSADLYRKALEIQPLHAQGLLYLADSLAQLKQDREALKYFEKHLNIHPKSIDGNFVAAGIWQDMGRRGKAIELLQRVVAVSPRDGDALYNLATLYAEEGHKKKAATSLKSLVKFNAKDHGAHSFLAELLTELGDEKGASEHRATADKLKTRIRE
eukprot:scpid54223/ scgid26812/ Prolyl 4-hydroxylase subunit alpha-2; Procollagen-proline,2-oxoglutarate-4-dioxygenase subunit alpha-2